MSEGMKWITPAELWARRSAAIKPAKPKKEKKCRQCGKGKPDVEFRSGLSRTCDGCLAALKKARQDRYTEKRNKRRAAARARGEKRDH